MTNDHHKVLLYHHCVSIHKLIVFLSIGLLKVLKSWREKSYRILTKKTNSSPYCAIWESRDQTLLWWGESASTRTPQSRVHWWCGSNFCILALIVGINFWWKGLPWCIPKGYAWVHKEMWPRPSIFSLQGINEHFNAGNLPSFNMPSGRREEHLDHVTISRRADPGVFVANRAVIPQWGQLSVHSAHFRPAECLPPAPCPRPESWMSVWD